MQIKIFPLRTKFLHRKLTSLLIFVVCSFSVFQKNHHPRGNIYNSQTLIKDRNIVTAGAKFVFSKLSIKASITKWSPDKFNSIQKKGSNLADLEMISEMSFSNEEFVSICKLIVLTYGIGLKVTLLISILITFWTPGLPEGVLSNYLRCRCVRVSVFKYLRDCSLVFSSFLHEVRAP